jgi:hypothetical protein
MSSTITPETQVTTEGAPPTKEAFVDVAFKASGLPVSDIALARLKKVEPEAAKRSKYWNLRRNNKLYSRFLKLVREEAPDALTVLDVGAYESPYISLFDWIPTKVATDIQSRDNVWNDMDGIAFVQGDFMTLNFATVFDVVICNQVVEHIDDDKVKQFVAKMQSIAKVLMVTTTYEMPFGDIQGHVQDPISENEFRSWFETSQVAGEISRHEIWDSAQIINKSEVKNQVVVWRRA